MKLYTRTGDDGTTGLFGGGRISKDHPRVEAYGSVDELNACIGLAIASRCASSSFADLVHPILISLQSRLFDIGADLATLESSKHASKIQRITIDHVTESEQWIDQVDAGNSPMSHFVMPGGTELAVRLHLARTVCRRAERLMVHLSHSEAVNPHAIVYMNRLSDLLFAMARRANKEDGIPDIPWLPSHHSEP